MEQEQLEKIRVWFDDYVAGFYGDDEFVNANIELKEKHSRRTCEETLGLAEELGLTDNQKRIADAIALLHDVGRFEQFVKYRTYNDPRSVNHCLLGIEVLRQTKVLEPVETQEKELIEKAIEYHGLRELPQDLSSRCLLFSKLIRDADKVDVFYILTKFHKQYTENPQQLMLELEYPDEPYCSAGVVHAILNEQLVDYSSLRTLNDMNLCLLGWVYDVNFTATFKRIRQRRFLETLFGFLPQTEDVRKVKDKILGYVDSRLNRQV